ncbi:hypothetical protein, partial [Ochrobactrum sp. SFR4]|uniref:hypothetical protein n=1 Tax=Ochrobactrum sp. SFR4 TaxID=2717368 RepID=UPI001C8C94AA
PSRNSGLSIQSLLMTDQKIKQNVGPKHRLHYCRDATKRTKLFKQTELFIKFKHLKSRVLEKLAYIYLNFSP